jgi:acyl-CoA thioesterase-1
MKIFIILLVLISTLVACTKTDIASNTVPVAPIQKTILALWDSLTAGYGLPESDSYPSQLQKKLKEKGYDYQVQNAGISGDTSAGLLSRMDWLLTPSDPSANTSEFSFAILCIGGNDAFQGKSPEDIEKNIRAIIEKLQAKKIPILFAGMKAPLNLGGEYGKQYEAIFPRLAKEYDLVYMDFFLEGVVLKANLNQDDRIHPTREGYAIIVENLMKILESDFLKK